MMDIETAIVGVGPGAIAAAIQLHQSGRDFVIFGAGEIGGMLRNAHWVENHPGQMPASGIERSEQLASHLRRLNIQPIKKNVDSIDIEGSCYQLKWDEGKRSCKN